MSYLLTYQNKVNRIIVITCIEYVNKESKGKHFSGSLGIFHANKTKENNHCLGYIIVDSQIRF